MASVEITQIQSIIDRPERQKRTMKALGLGKINKTVTKELTPQIAGMVNSIQHLVSVKEV
ncbi:MULTISPECIES: 50S ribosomal protein L30 [Rufibacter]|uniref:Large ribosomal subunit protein uL30 n=1 Tax=Rufibacter hautae TaxID=2595005 RepID=A0A5B6TB52_9BACT|nr:MULTISPECIES: 50S ribosomal protein L30 [Rufibacter]KAA3436244.1 50S ribosomal protein L30 [Rufibacter hautae]